MVFSGLLFLFLYLPITLAVYYVVPRAWRNLVLFIVSLVFYGWGEPVYIALMLFSITLNYVAGFLVEKWRGDKKAKRAVSVSVILNLALLVFFKYYDFLAGSVNDLTGLSLPILHLSLPIGISFYTFQAMSYPIDLYRRDAELQRSYVRFGAFVTLFPQLIAGPIIRYKDVADQLNFRIHSAERFSSGVIKFSVGLAKKVLLANNIGLLWDATIARPTASLSVMSAFLGVVAFTFQIYFDFSGYSDMAVGLGRMLGFEFLENFNYPYIARSITDFWRRWHISLSTWFRDYVYIPLGGNRVSTGKHYRNIFVVWMLTGFWHGASWNFLLWGVYFAVLLMVEKAVLLKWLKKIPAVFSHIYTMVLVMLSWAIFAIEDFGTLGAYLGQLFGGGAFADAQFCYDVRSFAVLLVILVLASTPLPAKLYGRLSEKTRAVLAPVLVLLALVLSTAYLVDSTYNPFLYFRF
ncbi:MAG: MBOAT family protein [Ruminococcaceae bacterium]|nr:MBOAT family protein [Oscillospiraceae bacterium]